MHDEVDDAAQIEWYRKWSEKKMQRKSKGFSTGAISKFI